MQLNVGKDHSKDLGDLKTVITEITLPGQVSDSRRGDVWGAQKVDVVVDKLRGVEEGFRDVCARLR